MKVILSVVLLLSYIALAVKGFSTGPPGVACTTLSPSPTIYGHNAEPQTTNVPYSVDVDTVFGVNGMTKYYPGRTYTLTISGDMAFKGFFVQARKVSDDSTRVGVFIIADTNNTKLSPCPTNTDGITHSNGNNKNNVMFNWTAPAAGTGDIKFGFAVVQIQAIYWADQRSVVVSEVGASPATTSATNGAATSTTSLSAMSLLLIGILTAMKIIG